MPTASPEGAMRGFCGIHEGSGRYANEAGALPCALGTTKAIACMACMMKLNP